MRLLSFLHRKREEEEAPEPTFNERGEETFTLSAAQRRLYNSLKDRADLSSREEMALDAMREVLDSPGLTKKEITRSVGDKAFKQAVAYGWIGCAESGGDEMIPGAAAPRVRYSVGKKKKKGLFGRKSADDELGEIG